MGKVLRSDRHVVVVGDGTTADHNRKGSTCNVAHTPAATGVVAAGGVVLAPLMLAFGPLGVFAVPR